MINKERLDSLYVLESSKQLVERIATAIPLALAVEDSDDRNKQLILEEDVQ